MDDFKSIRRQPPVFARNDEPKVMVQCSTGSGRCGVFILLEVLMFAVEHGGLTLEKVNWFIKIQVDIRVKFTMRGFLCKVYFYLG